MTKNNIYIYTSKKKYMNIYIYEYIDTYMYKYIVEGHTSLLCMYNHYMRYGIRDHHADLLGERLSFPVTLLAPDCVRKKTPLDACSAYLYGSGTVLDCTQVLYSSSRWQLSWRWRGSSSIGSRQPGQNVMTIDETKRHSRLERIYRGRC